MWILQGSEKPANLLLTHDDDNNGIKIGEPDCPVAAVERGIVVVGASTKFAIADHDFCKGSFTPSVSLICDILETIEANSVYRGQVYSKLRL